MEYSNLYGSEMPSAVMPSTAKKDIDSSVMNYINTYNSYLKANNIRDARQYYDDHKSALEPYIINAEFINNLQEELYNCYVASQRNYCVVSDTEPSSDAQDIDGIWYQEM